MRLQFNDTRCGDYYRSKSAWQYGLKQLIFPKDTLTVEDRAYFYFEFMLNRIKADNIFVTRIKSSTLYLKITELELTNHIDQGILKDKIIQLCKENRILEQKLRFVHVYKEDVNKAIAITTNQLDWEYNTIA